MGCPGVLLVGDAAGLVSPLTAGGIHSALHYGRMAGLAVTDYLSDHGPEPAMAMRHKTPRYFFKSALRSLYNLPIPNRVFDRVLDSPAFRSMAQTIFFHNRGLFHWATWGDVWRLVFSREERSVTDRITRA